MSGKIRFEDQFMKVIGCLDETANMWQKAVLLPLVAGRRMASVISADELAGHLGQ